MYYLYSNTRNRKKISYKSIKDFLTVPLESITVNNEHNTDNYNGVLYTYDYPVINFLASYSSFPTSFATHYFMDNKLTSYQSLFSQTNTDKEIFNDLFNKRSKIFYSRENKLIQDFLFFDGCSITSLIKDTTLNPYRALYNRKSGRKNARFYAYIDNISAISLLGNEEYKNEILKVFYSNFFTSKDVYDYLMNNTIKEIVIELFNQKQNGDVNIYTNEVYKKIYEEFLYRLFYNLNINLIDIIEEIKNTSYISSVNQFINFKEIHKIISLLSEKLYESLINTFYNGDFIERITRETISNHLNYSEKNNISNSIDNKINDVEDNIRKFAVEFEKKYYSDKEIIENRAYNIFLTKLNYFLCSFASNSYSKEYEKKFSFSLDIPIKIYLLSSAIQSILLNKTDTRTDHFEKHIILNCKNIGYKISTYNSRLEKRNIYDSEGNIIEAKDVMFYETFYNSFFKPNEEEILNTFFFYKDRIKFDDFQYENKNIFDNNPSKDINFFYGKRIKQSMLYKEMLSIATPNDFKTKSENMNVLINESREMFLNNSYRNSSYESLINEKTKYYVNKLDINSIEFPFMNFGFIPTHYTECFYDDYKNKKSYFMKDIMKQRVIGNIDPFRNLEEISNIVLENENYIIPDYDICIYKKEYSSDYSGEVYKTINSKIYLFLKNAASISIVKNPKTKIKSMTVILNNTSKSIFNFNAINGSFDIKSLDNGKIEIIHVEPGDEIRVRIGFDKKIQMFNGFINVIENTGNQLILQCSSFASLLYNEKITELDMRANEGNLMDYVYNGIGKFVKTVANKVKTTLEEISSSQVSAIRNLHNISNPLNNHLFVSFDGKRFFNNVFADGEKATMYTAFNLALANLKSISAEKFVKSKLSDITNGKMAYETLIKESLNSFTGNMSLDTQAKGTTYDIYTNINNVDLDYENYGLSNSKLIYFPYSINNFAYNGYKNEKNKETIYEYNKQNENIEAPTMSNFDSYGEISLPVDPATNVITSLYKEQRTYGTHKGIDICCNSNSSRNIYSIADGVVSAINHNNTGSAGKYVKVKHKIPGQEKYFESGYMHLSKTNVTLGQQITRGTLIGIMGNTGRSSGEHLHFEVYTLNNNFDKYLYINPFDSKMLPKHNWNVDWNLVNINADNGQYTEEWKESYSKSKKMLLFNNGGIK